MLREGSLEDFTDGKLYTANDLVKVGCEDCKGCSACCHATGDTIQLDPYDICRLSDGLHQNFEQMLGAKFVALSVVDGLILPHLNLCGPDMGCLFLNSEGRCSIHPWRPGICRLYPLGRYYEDGKVRYFLQTNECRKERLTKMKVKKWVAQPNLTSYEEYIADWHGLIAALRGKVAGGDLGNEGSQKQIVMKLLTTFYLTPYREPESFEAFLEQYRERRKAFSE